MSDKLIYLYVKESPVGLKYLGQTTENPYKYRGSGKWWKRHLRFHNLIPSDIKTTILLETYFREEIKTWGLYYSTLWNIVEDVNWANLIPETGEHSTLGYKHTPENIEKIRKFNTGKTQSEESKRKSSAGIKRHIEIYGKTEKQIQSVINVWKGKKLPKYIIHAAKDASAIPVINKESGIVYDSVSEAANSINMYNSTFLHNLNWNNVNFRFEYVDEKLNILAQNKMFERELKFSHRNPKNLKTKSSKYIGVSWDKGKKKWVVQIYLKPKKVFLGRFDIEKQAAEAYQNYLEKYKQEKLNK